MAFILQSQYYCFQIHHLGFPVQEKKRGIQVIHSKATASASALMNVSL